MAVGGGGRGRGHQAVVEVGRGAGVGQGTEWAWSRAGCSALTTSFATPGQPRSARGEQACCAACGADTPRSSATREAALTLPNPAGPPSSFQEASNSTPVSEPCQLLIAMIL